MKKRYLILALSLLTALALSACGNKSENVQTQAAETTAAAETAAAETTAAAAAETAETETVNAANQAVLDALPEDFDEEYFEGVVTAYDGSTATLKNDSGETMSFDLASAERYDDGFFMEGAYAEIGYATLADGKVAALDLTVLQDIEQRAAIENYDPVICGTVQLNDINDLEIIDQNGVERDFDNSMARTVTFGQIKNGDKVYVYYVGSLFSEDEDVDEENSISKPITIKIVAEDALGSEEAQANYLYGEIDGIDRENGTLTLSTDSINFEVSVPEEMLEGIDEEDFIRVYYEGGLSGIMVDAVRIEKE